MTDWKELGVNLAKSMLFGLPLLTIANKLSVGEDLTQGEKEILQGYTDYYRQNRLQNVDRELEHYLNRVTELQQEKERLLPPGKDR